jgi:VanZ family protein
MPSDAPFGRAFPTWSHVGLWLPPILWMGVIVVLSTDVGSGEHTGRLLIPVLRWLVPGASALQIEALHGLARKAAHGTEYGILAVLWFRAFARGPGWPPGRAAGAALTVALGWALLDEAHQTIVLSRTASLGDVALDVLGAAAATAVARWGWRRAVDVATGALLWAAAAGGALITAVHLWVGLPAGLLWVSAPAAAVALVLRRRYRTAGTSGRTTVT